MPGVKTECTELSVGFGLLGLDPINASQDEVNSLFAHTLTAEKYKRFKSEFGRNPDFYNRLFIVGRNIQLSYPPFQNITSVQWLGPQQQASTASVAIDLRANQTPISVKAQSNVVWNPSPYNLFKSVPQGRAMADRTDNWYLVSALPEFQELYSFIHDKYLPNLPGDIQDFEATASKKSRKRIQSIIKTFGENEKAEFEKRYIAFCHSVAIHSANLFNDNIKQALQSPIRNSIYEIIARNFFRFDMMQYLLCGIDRNHDFAVVIPDITTWKREWAFTTIEAIPDLTRRQSVVDFHIAFQNKTTRITNEVNFHSEIRWSHGKFCGSPEAKLYKEFKWSELQFFSIII
jgi:hypothetical protein